MRTALQCPDVARAALGEPLRQTGQELFYRCPNPKHQDKHPSLQINPHKNVWLCGPCGVGGNPWQLAAFIGGIDPDDKTGVVSWLKHHGLLNGEHGSRWKRICEYPYHDRSGKPIYRIVRKHRDAAGGYEKTFIVEHPEGDGWVRGLGGATPTLFNLPQVLSAKYIIVTEGEKDAEAANALGFVGTTSPFGAGKWKTEFAQYFMGKSAAVIAHADEPGRKHTQEVAASLSGKAESLTVLELPGAKDLSEWVEKGGAREALLALIQSAPAWMLQFVEGSTVLDKVLGFIRRFVFLSESQARVAALWIVHTYVFAAADATPYLAITSAEKECGKTRLLEVFETLVENPWLTGRVTAAVLTRKIDAQQPTLLLDESDAAFGSDKEYAEALRGVLNTGHRNGGKASCCVGQGANITFRDFSTFCPKAIAGIGKLPDTVAGRAIPIRLKRTAPGEHVERFRRRDVETEAASLREQIEAWCASILERVPGARPELPEALTDRQQDGAEPLLAIADAAGAEWPEAARGALIALCVESQTWDDSIGKRLLADIRHVFESKNADRLPSAELAEALAEIETSPWGEWSHGKPLTAARLARLLNSFEVVPDCIRVGDKTLRGYLADQFQDAFRRYLPPGTSAPLSSQAPQNATTQQANAGAGFRGFSDCNTENDVAPKNAKNPIMTRLVALLHFRTLLRALRSAG